MGMSSGGNKGGVQSEINVTPLIDVLLVLLIIFLVIMPVMMKMETLEVPRDIKSDEIPDPNAVMLVVQVHPSGDITFKDNDVKTEIQPQDLLKNLRPRMEQIAARGSDKVVFVDFDNTVPWGMVVSTMDSIRALAADTNHDDVKVALKVRDEKEKADAAAVP